MASETRYDVIPIGLSDEAKAYAVDRPLNEAAEILDEANQLYEEYNIEYALAVSNGERETARKPGDPVTSSPP